MRFADANQKDFELWWNDVHAGHEQWSIEEVESQWRLFCDVTGWMMRSCRSGDSVKARKDVTWLFTSCLGGMVDSESLATASIVSDYHTL
jgi:hypothetical protein